MNNCIDANIEFYFKGERYSPSSTIDLDQLMEDLLKNDGQPPSLYLVLANENGIDTYSYQYEVMQEEEIRFSSPKGLAVDYFDDGIFDMAGFEIAWRAQRDINYLQSIAKQHLSIDDLGQHPELKAALIAAYKLGKKSP